MAGHIPTARRNPLDAIFGAQVASPQSRPAVVPRVPEIAAQSKEKLHSSPAQPAGNAPKADHKARWGDPAAFSGLFSATPDTALAATETVETKGNAQQSNVDFGSFSFGAFDSAAEKPDFGEFATAFSTPDSNQITSAGLSSSPISAIAFPSGGGFLPQQQQQQPPTSDLFADSTRSSARAVIDNSSVSSSTPPQSPAPGLADFAFSAAATTSVPFVASDTGAFTDAAGGSLASAAGGLVDFDFLGGLPPKEVAVVHKEAALAPSPTPQAPPEHDEVWYHPDFDRKQAEEYLATAMEDSTRARGNFCVRASGTRDNCLVVSYFAKQLRGRGNEIRHTLIFKHGNGYSVDSSRNSEREKQEATLEALLRRQDFLIFPKPTVDTTSATDTTRPTAVGTPQDDHVRKSRWSDTSQFEGLFAEPLPPDTAAEPAAVEPMNVAKSEANVSNSISETDAMPSFAAFGEFSGSSAFASDSTVGQAVGQAEPPTAAVPIDSFFSDVSTVLRPQDNHAGSLPLNSLSPPSDGQSATSTALNFEDFGSFTSANISSQIDSPQIMQVSSQNNSNVMSPRAGEDLFVSFSDAPLVATSSSESTAASRSMIAEPASTAQVHALQHAFDSLCEQERFNEAVVCQIHLQRATRLRELKDEYVQRKQLKQPGLLSLRSDVENLEIQPHGVDDSWRTDYDEPSRLVAAETALTASPRLVSEKQEQLTSMWTVADLHTSLLALHVSPKSITSFLEQFQHADLTALGKNDPQSAAAAKLEALIFARGVLEEHRRETVPSMAVVRNASATTEALTPLPLTRGVVESWQKLLEASVGLCEESTEVLQEFTTVSQTADAGAVGQVVAEMSTSLSGLCCLVTCALRVRETLRVYEDALKLSSQPVVLLFICDKLDTVVAALQHQLLQHASLEATSNQLTAIYGRKPGDNSKSTKNVCELCWHDVNINAAADNSDLVSMAVDAKVQWSGGQYHAVCANLYKRHVGTVPPHMIDRAS